MYVQCQLCVLSLGIQTSFDPAVAMSCLKAASDPVSLLHMACHFSCRQDKCSCLTAVHALQTDYVCCHADSHHTDVRMHASMSAAVQSSDMAQRTGKLKLKQLAQDAQTLRDVKHFVKDYQGHLALPLPHLSKPLPFTRLMSGRLTSPLATLCACAPPQLHADCVAHFVLCLYSLDLLTT